MFWPFLPVILSALLLAAHFLRFHHLLLVAICLLLPLLLLVRKSWAARTLQAVLLLGALLWIRITVVFVRERQAMGEPWLRMVLILGGVALFTAASALVFEGRGMKRRYGLARTPDADLPR